MTKSVEFENQIQHFTGAPFSGSVFGAPFTSLEGTARTVTSFRSQSNLLWMMSQEKTGLRGETARKQIRKQRIDVGNGYFHIERFHRTPKYGQSTSINRDNEYVYQGAVPLGLHETAAKQLITQGLTWPTREAAALSAIALGSKAISATLPTKSHLNLAVSLAELRREGLPKLIGATLIKKPRLSSAGSEYLNVQFGWAPIISDVVGMLKLVKDSAAMLREYHNLSGHHTRRKYRFKEISEFDSYNGSSFLGTFLPHSRFFTRSIDATSIPHVSRKYTQNTWFSGAYVFTLPYGEDMLSQINLWEAEANKLLGIRITPEVLYNLTAWSWLFDWFVNIGDVMTNISHLGRDGLVMHYGYLMQTTRIRAEVTLPKTIPYGKVSPVSETFILERKQRIQASPYGFGLTTSDFTPKQWSILAALGLSRAHGVL